MENYIYYEKPKEIKKPSKLLCFFLAMLAPIIYLGMQTVVQFVLVFPMIISMSFTVVAESITDWTAATQTMTDLIIVTTIPSMAVAGCVTMLIFYLLFKGVKNVPIARGIEPKMFKVTMPSVIATVLSAAGINVALTYIVEVVENLVDMASLVDKVVPGLGEMIKQNTEEATEILNLAMNASTPVFVFLAVAIIGPIVEEVAFRQISLRALSSAFSIKTAIILQALFFAVAHGTPIQMLYTFGVGIVAGVAYYRTRSLFIPILFHVVFNATAYAIPYVASEIMTQGFAIAAAIATVIASAATVYLCAFSKAHKNQAEF